MVREVDGGLAADVANAESGEEAGEGGGFGVLYGFDKVFRGEVGEAVEFYEVGGF